MEGLFFISSLSYLLLGVLLALIVGLAVDLHRHRAASKTATSLPTQEMSLPPAPGPKAWPVIGSLHLLGGYEVPYAAFHALAQTYGPIFSIKLGQVNCLVVSSLQLVREVLIQKGDHFDGRPNFTRYNKLFGDKQNSLAFSDWSDLQKSRREMLRAHTFPRAFTDRFHQLDNLLIDEIHLLCSQINVSPGNLAVKPLMLRTCANLFLTYFTSKRFAYEDPEFQRTVDNFDRIFFEVNQGYAADFLPWLLPLHSRNLKKMSQWSKEIRNFMVDRVMGARWDNGPETEEPDYLDALLEAVKAKDSTLPLNTALFALEDIVGGHSAVANLLMKVLGFVATRPHVQAHVQAEADAVTRGTRDVTLADRALMPYTEAVILETIRMISSPIVPHVANKDSSVGGYKVDKDTLIFLNNYSLNMSPEFWDQPTEFAPQRFLSSEGKLVKPEHFLPFGGGRRSCMGYRMTQYVCFATLATLLHRYSIHPADNQDYNVPLGNLALPYDTFKFTFQLR